MEDSPLGLDKWMVAIWMLSNCKNGISSYELHRAIGITQKSAWFMLHRIRLALQTDGGKFGGEVEVDETYIGGKARFIHDAKRKRLNVKQGRSIAGKTVVMGLLERDERKDHSRVKTKVLTTLKRAHINAQVRDNVEVGSTVHTDSSPRMSGCPQTTRTTSSTTPWRTSTGTCTPTDAKTCGRC